jgi:hypothetical protein
LLLDTWCFVNNQLGGIYPNILLDFLYKRNIIEARTLSEKALAIIERMHVKILENGEKIYSLDG